MILLTSNSVNLGRTEIERKGEKMAFGVVKRIQREGMTRSEDEAINSFDNFKVSRVEGRRYMHEYSFYCTVLIFTAFFSYALLIFYL